MAFSQVRSLTDGRIAQLVERQTNNLEVVGSIPTVTTLFVQVSYNLIIVINTKMLARSLNKVSRQFAQVPKRSISLLVNDQFLTEEQKMIQDMAYGFAKTEFEPYAAEWDKKKHFPIDQYKKAADLGFGGIYVSEQYGGCSLGRLEASLIFEALATGQ